MDCISIEVIECAVRVVQVVYPVAYEIFYSETFKRFSSYATRPILDAIMDNIFNCNIVCQKIIEVAKNLIKDPKKIKAILFDPIVDVINKIFISIKAQQGPLTDSPIKVAAKIAEYIKEIWSLKKHTFLRKLLTAYGGWPLAIIIPVCCLSVAAVVHMWMKQLMEEEKSLTQHGKVVCGRFKRLSDKYDRLLTNSSTDEDLSDLTNGRVQRDFDDARKDFDVFAERASGLIDKLQWWRKFSTGAAALTVGGFVVVSGTAFVIGGASAMGMAATSGTVSAAGFIYNVMDAKSKIATVQVLLNSVTNEFTTLTERNQQAHKNLN
eukprot:GEMP01061278.1.p1 GENE.GEMP01061278.1~~GEMP01061278.1.p1  ORF type:complete len:331 (-),score=33.43 GEMP01061278.1:414-1379(-)